VPFRIRLTPRAEVGLSREQIAPRCERNRQDTSVSAGLGARRAREGKRTRSSFFLLRPPTQSPERLAAPDRPPRFAHACTRTQRPTHVACAACASLPGTPSSPPGSAAPRRRRRERRADKGTHALARRKACPACPRPSKKPAQPCPHAASRAPARQTLAAQDAAVGPPDLRCSALAEATGLVQLCRKAQAVVRAQLEAWW